MQLETKRHPYKVWAGSVFLGHFSNIEVAAKTAHIMARGVGEVRHTDSIWTPRECEEIYNSAHIEHHWLLDKQISIKPEQATNNNNLAIAKESKVAGRRGNDAEPLL